MISHSSSFGFGGKTASQMRTPEITAHIVVNATVTPLNITTLSTAKKMQDITAIDTQMYFAVLSILMRQDWTCDIVVDATPLPRMEG